MNDNDWFYIARKDSCVVAYTDAVKNDASSIIVEAARFQIPEAHVFSGPKINEKAVSLLEPIMDVCV